jgi:hypothetical protein
MVSFHITRDHKSPTLERFMRDGRYWDMSVSMTVTAPGAIVLDASEPLSGPPTTCRILRANEGGRPQTGGRLLVSRPNQVPLQADSGSLGEALPQAPGSAGLTKPSHAFPQTENEPAHGAQHPAFPQEPRHAARKPHASR